MRKWVLAAVAALSVGQAEAATIGSGVYSVRYYAGYGDPVIGRFSFLPDAVEAAKLAGEETATILRDDLISFQFSDPTTQAKFSLADVLDSFAIVVRFSKAKGSTHVLLTGNTSVLAVSGPYTFSFINGYDVLIGGPGGGERPGHYGIQSAYVPLPAGAPLLGGALMLLAGYRRRRSVR